jgi:hypothetical protein
MMHDIAGLYRRLLATVPGGMHVLRLTAYTHLARADEARDARDWPTAARFYGKYLRLDPARAEIWVQFGHSKKELDQMSV